MKGKDAVQLIDFGASVAEFDTDLEEYFVETETFRKVIGDQGDVIAGDKGTGKTAIYRVLKKSYKAYSALSDIEIVDAFNPQGNPIFQRLTNGPALTEGQYRTVWKAYIFALVGNWLISKYPSGYNSQLTQLENTLRFLGLHSIDVSPTTVFGNLYEHLKRITAPSAIETTFTVTESGMPVVTPRIEFGGATTDRSEIYNDDYLRVLDAAISSTDLRVWVLFDRLDEAFAGYPDFEIPALRALMRTYLDLTDLRSLKLKLFVRRDLFRRITTSGFVNLTHINSRRIDIVWDEEDLISMIARRLRRSKDFRAVVGQELTDKEVFAILLPLQIDFGKRKATSQTWIMSRIRDGNNNRPPRNLIDLLNLAKETQARREARDERNVDINVGPLIESDSMRRGIVQLSERRVQDTLLAEANDLSDAIRSFRDGRAEHNESSLNQVLVNEPQLPDTIRALVDIGFLEEFGPNYKVPMLYRAGLKITQGKAF